MLSGASSPPHLFVFGLGYVGLQVGLSAQELGWRVSGSVRAAEKATVLEQTTGIEVHTFDLDDEYTGLSAGGSAALADATHLVCTVPPVADLDRDPLLALHGEDLRTAASEGGRLQWVGYLSTTSVYGDHGGAWVDELSETRAAPTSPGGRRLASEREWLDLEDGSGGCLAVRVFRLAGIYGPGRSALDTVARAAVPAESETLPVPPPPLTPSPPPLSSPLSPPTTSPSPSSPSSAPPALSPPFVSRVHVEDICSALLASMQQPYFSGVDRVYNVADDDPAPRTEVMDFAATLLGLPRTAAESAVGARADGGRARRRAAERKRVSNARLRSALLSAGLKHPTYREGLEAIWRETQ